MDFDTLIDHITNERGDADFEKKESGDGAMTIPLNIADELSKVFLEAYGVILRAPGGHGELADKLALLHSAFKEDAIDEGEDN